MLNFILGTVAGGLIACIATISAARHPEVQARLGLIASTHAHLMPAAVPAKPEPACPPPAVVGPSVNAQELLFSKRRFWSVTP